MNTYITVKNLKYVQNKLLYTDKIIKGPVEQSPCLNPLALDPVGLVDDVDDEVVHVLNDQACNPHLGVLLGLPGVPFASR